MCNLVKLLLFSKACCNESKTNPFRFFFEYLSVEMISDSFAWRYRIVSTCKNSFRSFDSNVTVDDCDDGYGKM